MYKISDDEIKYIQWITRRMYAKHGRVPSEDDIQDALEQVCKAALVYDEKRDVKFTSFVRDYIKKSMTYKKTNRYRKDGSPTHADMFFVGKKISAGSNDHCNKFNTKRKADMTFGDNGITNLAKTIENKDLVVKTLAKFPPKVQEALRRHYYGGEEYNAIAKDMGYGNPGSLSKHIHDWVKKVRGGDDG